MLTQISIFVLSILAFAMESRFAFPSALQPAHSSQQIALTGRLENNDGKLRLVLSNASLLEFRGICRISLGSDNEQKEIGQVQIALPPQETVLLQTNSIPASGDQYTMAIFDQNGFRRFLKIAPLRRISDSTPAIAIALTPIQQRPKANSIVGNPPPLPSQNNKAEDFAREASQVQVQARLLANEESNDSFLLSLELRAQLPVKGATISITAGKVKDKKPVSINPQARIEFKLPEQLEAEQISYVLTAKDGRVLAKGDLNLQELMADDLVTINDIRTDRASYDPGETARLTALIEGKSKQGYRLEVSARDGQGQSIFRDQKVVGAEDNVSSLEFSVALPESVNAPVVFEFRVFNAETGLMLDSGEREIPMNSAKPPRRP
ncbi:MAG TPA: hypothetical protein PKC13_29380 [Blastocatellia bacterium]|nr:hypothetical protein [Blastocatellia bacterium]HMX29734.1 hypothetical protein [Blastocatellia bacterium]HMY72535.1 hypothetical protein [Blastocatellia bacterium]